MGDVFSGIANVGTLGLVGKGPISGFLGMGGTQQQSSGSQQQQQGFAQFPDLQKAIAEFGFGNVQSLAQPLTNRIGAAIPTVGETGLFPQQEQAFRVAVQQALGSASSDFAQRGFLRPENINAIAGSAAQNVMPQFAPLIGQQVIAPEQITQNRISQLLQLISLYPGLLGGQATQISAGQSNFPNFMQAIAPAYAQGAAQSMFAKAP